MAEEDRKLASGRYEKADWHKAQYEGLRKELESHLMAREMEKPRAGEKWAQSMAEDAQRRQEEASRAFERAKAQPKPLAPPLTREQQQATDRARNEALAKLRAEQGHAKAADAAVAHQQAQADLAAYRASKDRNPNPWAPHLSPPVGDAKDRELQEKATRAQLAHQAVQAQQQAGAQQQQATGTAQAAQPVLHSVGKPGETDDEREQRLLAEHKQHKARFDAIFRSAHNDAGYKERRDLTDRMNDIGGEVQALRDKRAQGAATAKPAIKPLQAPPTPASAGKPGEITKEHIQAKVMAGEHLTREEKGFVLNGYRMPKPKPEEPTKTEAPTPAAAGQPKAQAAPALTTPRPQASKKAEPAPSRADLHQRLSQITPTALTSAYDRKQAQSALDLLTKAYEGYDKAGRSTLNADIAGRHHDAARDAAQRLLTSNLSSGNPTEVAYSRALHHLAQDALGSAHTSLREAEAHGKPAPEQKTLAAEAPTGPVQHKPATAGDPIQPQRARPVGQLGLLGEHKPFEAPKAKSEAEQAARGGQKSLFGSSFSTPEHNDEHVHQIMQAHAAKDPAGKDAYRQQMQRIASGESYKPNMPDGQPLSRATAAEAARRMATPAPAQQPAPEPTATGQGQGQGQGQGRPVVAHDPAHVAVALKHAERMSQRERANYVREELDRVASGKREGGVMPGGARMSAHSAAEAARQIRAGGNAARSQARPGESHQDATRRLENEVEAAREDLRFYGAGQDITQKDRAALRLSRAQRALDEHKRAAPHGARAREARPAFAAPTFA